MLRYLRAHDSQEDNGTMGGQPPITGRDMAITQVTVPACLRRNTQYG